jgi:hypothetical protein
MAEMMRDATKKFEEIRALKRQLKDGVKESP